jgi:hypothetical protein
MLYILYFNASVEDVNSEVVGLGPGANLTIASYNATRSLGRFEKKNIFFYYEQTI